MTLEELFAEADRLDKAAQVTLERAYQKSNWETRVSVVLPDLARRLRRLQRLALCVAKWRKKAVEYDEDMGRPVRSFSDEDWELVEAEARACLLDIGDVDGARIEKGES